MPNFLEKETATHETYFENDRVSIWIDEAHIIHSVYKNNAQVNENSMKEIVSFREKIHPGFPTGHLIDMREMIMMEMGFRKPAMRQNSSSNFKAIAVIVGNPVSEMIAKMIGQIHPEVQTKTQLFYNDSEQAYQWLLDQL